MHGIIWGVFPSPILSGPFPRDLSWEGRELVSQDDCLVNRGQNFFN